MIAGAICFAALSMFSMVSRSPRRCSALPPTATTTRWPVCIDKARAARRMAPEARVLNICIESLLQHR